VILVVQIWELEVVGTFLESMLSVFRNEMSFVFGSPEIRAIVIVCTIGHEFMEFCLF
jgi:hypothetical protein